MANDIAGIIQRKTFVGRVTYLSLVWAFTVVFGSSALALSADDVQAYLETQLGMAFGLFGFAGGATNWIAIVMLFDEIPGVFGSGIIPKQFKVCCCW